MIKNKQLPLRIGVGIILLNHENKVFVGKRIDNPKHSWQMPQGGVDQNENFLQAAKRELEEETGIKSVELIKYCYIDYNDDSIRIWGMPTRSNTSPISLKPHFL